MFQTPTTRLVEREFGAGLRSLLRSWSEQGLSVPQMGDLIRSRDIPVTDQTVWLWIRRLQGKQVLVFPEGEAAVS